MPKRPSTDATLPDATIAFEAPLQQVGSRRIVRLPPEASAKLPSRGQVAVRGVLNGKALETVVEPDGRRGHWLSLDGKVPAKLKAGDPVRIGLSPRKDWPEPQLPEDLQAALTEAPDLDGTWTSLTPMARWEWARWVCATRNPDTRARRVEVSISKLRSGKRRPCCFDLASCTDPELARSGKLIPDGD